MDWTPNDLANLAPAYKINDLEKVNLLPKPIAPREFCRLWFGYEKLDVLTLEKLETETPGIKKMYVTLLAKVLGVPQYRVNKWSFGHGHKLNLSLNFQRMPIEHHHTLGYALELKRIYEKLNS